MCVLAQVGVVLCLLCPIMDGSHQTKAFGFLPRPSRADHPPLCGLPSMSCWSWVLCSIPCLSGGTCSHLTHGLP